MQVRCHNDQRQPDIAIIFNNKTCNACGCIIIQVDREADSTFWVTAVGQWYNWINAVHQTLNNNTIRWTRGCVLCAAAFNLKFITNTALTLSKRKKKPKKYYEYKISVCESNFDRSVTITKSASKETNKQMRRREIHNHFFPSVNCICGQSVIYQQEKKFPQSGDRKIFNETIADEQIYLFI